MKKIPCDHGYAGTIAIVDLSTGEIDSIPTERYAPLFLGSRGLAEKVFWEYGNFDSDPFDPESVFVMMTSPLAGTLSSAANQMAMFGRGTTLPNPQLRASMCGSGFGAELKRCGYDGLVVKGASASPCFLYVHDGEIEIRQAELGTLWGLDTYAAKSELWHRFGDRACVMTIGPAGENLCRDAIVATDDCHVFGNGGFGAVWGSKKLKAIVAKGTRDITVSNPKALIDDVKRAKELSVRPPYDDGYQNSSRGMNMWSSYHFGTPKQDFLLKEEAGEIELGWSACLNCQLACVMTHRYVDGSGSGASHCEEEDVYSTVSGDHYGLNKGSKYAWQATELVQRAGLNAWSFTDHSVFTALVDAGLLTNEYTGLHMEDFGSIEFFTQLIDKIVNREPGFGNDLADGWYRVCEVLGDKAIAIYNSIIVKDMGHMDFQAGPGMMFKGALFGQWTNAMGMKRSTDLTGNLYYPLNLDIDLLYGDMDRRARILGNASEKFLGDRNIGLRPDDLKYAPEGGRWCLEQNVILDTTSLCSFAFPILVSSYTEDGTGELFAPSFINDVTGSDITEDELRFEFADRILALERLIAYRSGHHKDELREMNFAENGGAWPRQDVVEGQKQFFELFGWDMETGLPRKSTLKSLGLDSELADAEAVGVPLSD
ncbi:MAG: aldehyde ferredoxin oxidoreductase N-terminal domain-containing protein [Coriobacteriales bacterium]|jgi:aldehyde:ferredoxin oxidoreductase